MDALNFRRVLWLTVAVLLFAGVGAGAQTSPGPELMKQLRGGGYVLLMRHARSPVTLPDKNSADAANIHFERQLDETGRITAHAMGDAMRKLDIPIGLVLSSPTYRALETVRLTALGTPQTYAQLGDGGQSMSNAAVSDQADWLREKVEERPKPGSNTIIVTHMPNIQAAFEKDAADLTDGEALIFHPDGRGGADLVAKIKIEDWPSLVRY
jgi:phosphohistidine phosphatase SixA